MVIVEDDEWTTDGDKITEAEIARLMRIHDEESCLIVEHAFYREAQAPHRFVTSDSEQLATYLRAQVQPGDGIYVWKFEQCCTDDNAALRGKIPDDRGRVPKRGAY